MPVNHRSGIAISKASFSLLAFVTLLAILVFGVASARAESPWWHLTSGSRPTSIQPGTATDEVQEIAVSGTGGKFAVIADSQLVLFEWDATPGEVEKNLEGVYGTGNVKVAGGPGDETGSRPYVVTFQGALADQAVEPMNTAVSAFFLTCEGATGSGCKMAATLTEKTKGHADGQIVLTADNLGDAGTSECVKVAAGTGKYADSACTEPAESGREEFEKTPVVIADKLPAGFRAVAIEGIAGDEGEQSAGPVQCSVAPLACTFAGVLPPYDQIEVLISVVAEGAASGVSNEVSVSGGAAPGASIKRPVTVGGSSTPFGAEDYELAAEEEGGSPDTLAGSHPFQLTTTFTLNQNAEANPVAPAKDLRFKLPPGLIGNPTPFPRCTLAQFAVIHLEGVALNDCPPQTAVGVAVITVNGKTADLSKKPAYTFTAPIFNLEPSPGEPARFGFELPRAPVFLDTSVRSGGDYGVTVTASNITQTVAFLKNEVTFWGVPGDPRHDNQRGWNCLADARKTAVPGPCNVSEAPHPPPFLSLPTSCPTSPASGLPEALQTSVEADSWLAAGSFQSIPSTAPMVALDGCNRLPFSPEVKVTPDGTAASSPSGLNVDVHVPQDSVLSGQGLAESNVKEITVALPEGVVVNPAGGDGLGACSEGLVGFEGFKETQPGLTTAAFTPRVPGGTAALAAGEDAPLKAGLNFCPDSSKIGTVEIVSPLLPKGQPLKGAVYLAAQNSNPFGSLVAIYVVAEDPVSGTVVKQTGEVHLTPSGQLVTTLKGVPQLAFEDAQLHFFGGERAPLSSPSHCGTYTTNASFTPWSGNEAVSAASSFDITTGPHGSACPGASLPFSPSLTSGTTNINAGAFSDLTTTIGREDGQQDMQSVTLHYPPGVSGLLAGVKLCGDAEANAGTCGSESQIGATIVSAGVGSDPVSVTGGKVFITGPYNGTGACTPGSPGCAPFGLSIVNPVKAGPFDLEHDTANPNQNPACDCVVVRAKIEVDPSTAALTITTNPSGAYAIPHLIDGIPVQIKKVNVLVNRPGFTFNPTNCAAFAITGSIGSDEGASSPVSVPFQATNCAVLKFEPKFAVSASGKTSKTNGASLTATLSEPAGAQGTQSNIAKVKVELPKQLPSRLTTLQKACTTAQFNANPAACPAASKIGYAIVHTPLLPVPLEGPAIFVSHGGEAFPSLTMVLQGYGITIDLVGTTFISKSGITSTTFKTVPDQPFSSFTLTLPEGPFSALAANGNLCAKKLTMPTEFVGQNGDEFHRTTAVSVTGCKTAIRVVKHSVRGHTATIVVSVPAAGRLVASGKGVSKGAGKSGKAQNVTVKVTLTKADQALLSKHKGRKLKIHVKLGFTPKKGSRLATSTTVSIG